MERGCPDVCLKFSSASYGTKIEIKERVEHIKNCMNSRQADPPSPPLPTPTQSEKKRKKRKNDSTADHHFAEPS